MEELMSYVKPELLVTAIVLYFIGVWIKQTQGLLVAGLSTYVNQILKQIRKNE